MRFAVKSLSAADFAKWVGATKAGGGTLDRADPLPFGSTLAGSVGQPVVGRAKRSEEHTSELQSLMRTSYAVICLNKNIPHRNQPTENKKHTLTKTKKPQ